MLFLEFRAEKGRGCTLGNGVVFGSLSRIFSLHLFWTVSVQAAGLAHCEGGRGGGGGGANPPKI